MAGDFGIVWDRLGIVWGSFGDRFGMVLDRFWTDFGRPKSAQNRRLDRPSNVRRRRRWVAVASAAGHSLTTVNHEFLGIHPTTFDEN